MTPRSTTVWLALAALLCVALSVLPSAQAPGQFDVLIRNGRVVDGTGAPWFLADVGVTGGRIAAMGVLRDRAAVRVIDARGLTVAPGFIDMMGQTAAPFIQNPNAALNLLTQGITTINAGDGESDAPLDEVAARTAGWKTMREFFGRLEQVSDGMHFVLVNGQVVLENGAYTGVKPGRILHGPGWKR